MKRKNPYIRICLFELLLLLVLCVNSFIYNFLSNYYMIAFLIIILLLFKFTFGFEKDRHRHTKDVIVNILIFLMTFFILYYLFGITIGFVRNAGYYSIYGFTNFTLRITIYVILREFLRYQMLNKCDGNRFSTSFNILLFMFLDISNNVFFYTFSDKYNIFIFFALYLLPSLGTNLLGTYLSKKTGYKPLIFYMLVMELYTYLLPIYPNPNKYLASIINFTVPMILLYKQYSYFRKESDEDIPRNYNKKGLPWLVICLVLTIVLVYFSSGYFHYHAVAVASGSMHPVIEKGDVVIVERVDDDFGRVQVGDVIAFNYNGTIVVHRVINIIQDRSEYFFYTKGDANEGNDNFVVEMDMLKGIVKYRIPFIGYPTVWLNRL